jgi:hypothetical protein
MVISLNYGLNVGMPTVCNNCSAKFDAIGEAPPKFSCSTPTKMVRSDACETTCCKTCKKGDEVGRGGSERER